MNLFLFLSYNIKYKYKYKKIIEQSLLCFTSPSIKTVTHFNIRELDTGLKLTFKLILGSPIHNGCGTAIDS